MITRYRLVAARLRTELPSLEQLVARASTALERAARQPQDQDYFFAAAALDLHGFYAGLERLFELIAEDVDPAHPGGSHRRRDLLAQMTLEIERVRPAVLAPGTSAALTDYLDFRHIVRNVYAFNLRPERVAELVRGLRPTLELVRRDLTAGVFIEDYIVWQGDQGVPTYDPWVLLAAMAMRTQRVCLSTQITPLARRRPWKVTREAVTLDHLSNGRVILGVGLGDNKEQ